MTIATILLLVNTLFSVCGLFVFIRIYRYYKKGEKMEFREIPSKKAENPLVDNRKMEVVPPPPQLTEEQMRDELQNLTMDDVLQAMQALGVK